jgi:hypothetical protein
MRTRLTCGHSVDGVHLGPAAWCAECMDWVRPVKRTGSDSGSPGNETEEGESA